MMILPDLSEICSLIKQRPLNIKSKMPPSGCTRSMQMAWPLGMCRPIKTNLAVTIIMEVLVNMLSI